MKVASLKIIAVLATLPLASAGLATDTAASGHETQAIDPGSERLCKTIRPTGSRIGKRVCRSRDEWNQAERAAQSAIDESKDSGQAFQPR